MNFLPFIMGLFIFSKVSDRRHISSAGVSIYVDGEIVTFKRSRTLIPNLFLGKWREVKIFEPGSASLTKA